LNSRIFKIIFDNVFENFLNFHVARIVKIQSRILKSNQFQKAVFLKWYSKSFKYKILRK